MVAIRRDRVNSLSVNSNMHCMFQRITFFGSRLWERLPPRGQEVAIEGASKPAIVHRNGMVLFGADGKMVRQALWSSVIFFMFLMCCCALCFYVCVDGRYVCVCVCVCVFVCI